jgi:protocatechuate 3,4-dioxygenase beta subunit
LLGGLLLNAFTEPKVPLTPGPGEEGQPYIVTGTVLDTQGRPMAGVKVRADNDALYGSAEVTTDASGK